MEYFICLLAALIVWLVVYGMHLTLTLAVGDGIVNYVSGEIDTGGAGTILIYTGSAPATPETSASGTLLATLTFSGTSFGSASAGTATANAITSATAGNTGIAGYARILNGSGTAIMDCTVGTSGTDFVFNTTSISAGDTVSCTSMTLTMPSA